MTRCTSNPRLSAARYIVVFGSVFVYNKHAWECVPTVGTVCGGGQEVPLSGVTMATCLHDMTLTCISKIWHFYFILFHHRFWSIVLCHRDGDRGSLVE